MRELENILERALTMCEGERIAADDLGLAEVTATPVAGTPADAGSLDEHLEGIERQTILKALEETRWNRTAAAKKLGISFRQLRYRLEKLGL